MVGRTDFDYYAGEMASAFFEDEQRIVVSGHQVITRNENIREKDGSIRRILTTKVPLRDEHGQVIGIIGIGRNITALKEVETELERAREDLRFKATHDSLTSLFNRGAILDMLARELARSAREDGCMTILLGDVDHFKAINDTHGHPVGDEVLQETSRRLLKSVRPYDLVGRYGGEEFLIILTNCPTREALLRANQLRRAIANTAFATACGPVPVTMSMGVLNTRGWSRLEPEDIMREVDVALYAAKAAGRNQCKFATPHSPK
jgi:diguanylate cyclase (GGDEF)-like protein